MDIDEKDLAYHYYQALKLVNELIDFHFDLLAHHHLSSAINCKQVSVIKAKNIEINLLRQSGYQYDNPALFKLCQTIFWASLQVNHELANKVNINQISKDKNDKPTFVVNSLIELHDLINTIKYLEARIGIVHNYEQYFTITTSNQSIPNENTTIPNEKTEQSTSQSVDQENNNQINQSNSQTNNQTAATASEKNDHPVRMQAKQVEQWLLNHFPSRQEYMDWSFQLKAIQNKLNELEQLMKTKKKPN